MAISRKPNGFYTWSDEHFKRRSKADLIDYIRTIEKNWENALITNEIQYENCMKLLSEERNKAIDEFAEKLTKYTYGRINGVYVDIPLHIFNEIVEQLKAGGME